MQEVIILTGRSVAFSLKERGFLGHQLIEKNSQLLLYFSELTGFHPKNNNNDKINVVGFLMGCQPAPKS